MCGITGFVDFNRKTPELTLHAMTDVLSYRGPDDSGYFTDTSGTASTGLGHRRLSILDLSAHGHQPMGFQNLTVTYNGEIYNFREIRKELIQSGYEFYSDSDTEVILKAYHRWGTDMLRRFNGMFAFAIYDKGANKIFLFRDRAGVKPLYWYFKDGLFLFSSELKSFHLHPHFLKELNYDGLALFLQYGYIPEPHTIFNHCYKLRGGHYLILDLQNRQISQTKYWDVMDFYRQPKINIPEEEAIEETEALLKSAFNYRLVADVPVGVFLSGGYDSSIVTAMLQSNRTDKIKTFTIGFHEEKYNEAPYAKKIAEYLGTEHKEYYCSKEEASKLLPRLPEIWDEPFGDPSAIPTILLSQLARRDVTVSLSADGGDETFAGYNKYVKNYKRIRALRYATPPGRFLLHRIFKSPLFHSLSQKAGISNSKERFTRLSCLFAGGENEIMAFSESCFYQGDLQALLRVPFKKVSTNFDEYLQGRWLDNQLAVDYKTYQIDDILTKVDRATMSVSLEGREPLLDYRVIEYTARLDDSLKINRGTKKYLLKKIAHKYIPRELLDRPKKGFSVPVFEWFKDDLKDYLLYYLDAKKIKRAGILDENMVIDLRDRYLSGGEINISKIWYLLMFEMWKEKWL
jgi:asparagine synthase (glutamine-hydrolysing)